MAKPGKKPKNVALKVIEGNLGKRPIPEQPKMPELGAEPPDDLSPAAKKIWMRWATSLIGQGLFSDIHQELLASTCTWWAEFKRLEKIVVKKGHATEGRRRGESTAMKDAYQMARAGMAELGITPAEMGRVRKPTDDGKDFFGY